LLGYRTRWIAAVIAAYCVATAVFFHRDVADPNMFLHFFKNIAMADGLLQIVAFGAGRYSLDACVVAPWRRRALQRLKLRFANHDAI
jgi:putative oxidoreductase